MRDPLYDELDAVFAAHSTQINLTRDPDLRRTVRRSIESALSPSGAAAIRCTRFSWAYSSNYGAFLIVEYPSHCQTTIARDGRQLRTFLEAVRSYTGIFEILVTGGAFYPFRFYWSGERWFSEVLAGLGP
jgi:hypothetical protein